METRLLLSGRGCRLTPLLVSLGDGDTNVWYGLSHLLFFCKSKVQSHRECTQRHSAEYSKCTSQNVHRNTHRHTHANCPTLMLIVLSWPSAWFSMFKEHTNAHHR